MLGGRPGVLVEMGVSAKGVDELRYLLRAPAAAEASFCVGYAAAVQRAQSGRRATGRRYGWRELSRSSTRLAVASVFARRSSMPSRATVDTSPPGFRVARRPRLVVLLQM